MFRSSLLCPLISLAIAGWAVASPPPSPEIPLNGPWRFQATPAGQDDSLALPALDDSGWKEVPVPGKWADHGYPNYLGRAWYRRVFEVPAGWRGEALTLELPPADQSDRVFLNGASIGGMINKPRTRRVYRVPVEAVRFGEKNVLAVEVTSKFGRGGFAPGEARLLRAGTFVPRAVDRSPGPALDLKTNGADWITGWHDPGTSDTRIVTESVPGRKEGESAVSLKIAFPNASGEFVDFRLAPGLDGTAWEQRGDDYLRFWYRTDDLEGEMRLHFNKGNFKFGTGAGGWSTSFRVKPGEWTPVILPFAEFAKRTHKSLALMPETVGLNTLSLGYKNNELRAPGRIAFAGFETGRMRSGPAETIAMSGLWHFRPDPEKTGLKAGWATGEPTAPDWAPLLPGLSWQAQGFRKYTGAAWMMQTAFVPPGWSGIPLRLRLGRVLNSFDNAEVFFNGQSVARTTKWDKNIDATIPSALVRPGEANRIAILLDGGEQGNQNGMTGSPWVLEPLPAWITLRTAGGDQPMTASAAFDPGPLPGRRYEISLRIPRLCLPDEPMRADFELVDCFFRRIAGGNSALTPGPEGPWWELNVALDERQSLLLYYAEFFDLRVQVTDRRGQALYAATGRNVTMPYGERDSLALEPLPERWEETPYGRLRLVDVVEAGDDPASGPHPYKQGGIRGSWVGRVAYATWEEGIVVREFEGKKYREANNSEWFGYRVGRGGITPGKAYLVRIEYPEDKTRYMPVNVDAGRNYQGLGFKTGVRAGNPYDDYPLSRQYRYYDLLVIPDALTYGSAGSRSTPVDHGFWIFFHDIGRSYASQYDAGPAVSRIEVYEVPDPRSLSPEIRLPEGEPQRLFIADWEREPETIPRDMVAHARFLGYNAIAPSVLKWGSLAYWQAKKLPLKPTDGIREPLPPDQPGALDRFLAATKEAGMMIFPRFEYGGSNAIPKELRAVAANGKPARPNRFHTWCADLLQPVVTEEINALFGEIVGERIADNPQIGGLLMRMRSDRLPISYSRYDVEMFARETGETPPAGASDEALAKWASGGPRGKVYADWWHGKRRDFHRRLAADLRKIRPDLTLLYYNWDSDNWNLGKYVRGPRDYTDAYNVHAARKAYERETAFRKEIPAERYVEMIREGTVPHHNVRPELYRDVPGFALLGPVNWRYLADNPAYINSFRTGDRLALTKIYNYEEKGRWNVQGDNYESSEMSPGGPDFAMAEQVLTVFHGDPWILTETTYTYGQGFADAHRRFAQAYLGLPAIPGRVVQESENLRVRLHQGKKKAYLSVVHRGMEPGVLEIRIPVASPDSVTLVDLVTGEERQLEPREGHLVFPLEAAPMSLRSFRLD